MDHVLIIIAGMPAAGKTTFAKYLSEELRIPLVCKDRVKEILFDELHYDAKTKSETQKFGALAYTLSWYFCEEIMKSGQPLIFESNLGAECPSKLRDLVQKYCYFVISVVFDGDMQIIHQRFLMRDHSVERHPGLVSGCRFDTLDDFRNAVEACRTFSYGEHVIRVDTSDFSRVCYHNITQKILSLDKQSKLI